MRLFNNNAEIIPFSQLKLLLGKQFGYPASCQNCLHANIHICSSVSLVFCLGSGWPNPGFYHNVGTVDFTNSSAESACQLVFIADAVAASAAAADDNDALQH